MAELYWDFQQYELSEASEGIGEVYSGVAGEMQQKGWEGVQHQQDLHGYKPGIDLFAAIIFLPVAGRTFWQGVAVGGGNATQQQAQQEIQELKSMIGSLKFL